MKRGIQIVGSAALLILFVFIVSGCSSAEKEELVLVDSGYSYDETGNLTYGFIIENQSDKVLTKATYNIEALDENGESMNGSKAVTATIKDVYPGEKAAYAITELKSDHMMGIGFSEIDRTPDKMEFTLQSASFSADKGSEPHLVVTDSDKGQYYEGGVEYISDAAGNTIDTVENNLDMQDYSILFENRSTEDYTYDWNRESVVCVILYKDNDGKLIGGCSSQLLEAEYNAELMGYDWLPGGTVFPAGEISKANASFYTWPHDSEEIYLVIE